MAQALSDATTRPDPDGPLARPWCEQWMGPSPASPARIGAAIALGVVAVSVAAESLSGDLGRWLRGEAGDYKSSEYRFTLIFALLAGYLPAAWVWTVRSSRRAFRELRPVLRGARQELDALESRMGRFDRRGLRRAGWIGVAIAVALPVAVDQTTEVYALRDLNTAALGHRLLVPVLLWMTARIAWAWVHDARRLVAISSERLEVDLLDLAPLAPLAQYGLRNALILLIALSTVSLMAADWASRPGLPWVLGGILALGLAIGLLGLLLPVRGAHRVIQTARARELAWCRDEIRRRRQALERGEPPAEPGRMAELVAYHGLVREVRAWPFDSSTLVRFVLYLGIPLGSWMGGALVERWLNLVLE